MSEKEPQNAFSADVICDLANKFLKQELYEDALELLQQGTQLYPENLSLKIQLGRARDAIRAASERLHRISPAAESVRRDHDAKANLFMGLGELFLHRKEDSKAVESFKRSIHLNPSFYVPFLRLGTLYYEQKEYDSAIRFLTRAKALNPFNEDICYYLSLSHFYLENYQEALVAMVDALILSGDLEKPEASPYQQKLQLLIEKFDGFDRTMRNKLIKERQQKFSDFYRSFNEEITQTVANLPVKKLAALQDEPLVSLSENELSKVSTLKGFFLFKNLDEKMLAHIGSFAAPRKFKQGDFVFKEGSSVDSLYLIEEGTVRIVKETPFGAIDLVTLREGQFFADDDFYDQETHRTSAQVDSETASVICINRGALIQLFQSDREMMLHFYWYFWKNLSFQIRQANMALQKFFTSQVKKSESKDKGAREQELEIKKRHAKIALEKKEAVLRTHGLEENEIKVLAKYSAEEIYDAGEYIFKEGTEGDRLFVILEGRVLISKRIDSVGEEALALLDKGDFFGEMALVDGEPRSADAKAQKNSTTVLAIKKDTIRDVLKMDVETACSFLNVLYRILNQRLQEIREKIYQWKVMAGGF